MRILAILAVAVSALGMQGPSAPPAGTPADFITREELKDHVYFLASDFLGGRRPDDPGYTIAAEYAASQFRAAGVRPAFMDAGGAPTYFQKVPMMKVTTTIDSPFILSTAAGDRVIEALDDFRLMSRGLSLTKVPLVFIGSGQIAPELKKIIAGVNAKTVNWPLDFESMEGSINGSDSFIFHGKGIPTAFLFSGRHEALHAPTDDAEKVDFEKVQRLSQLIYAVTAELGVRDASIKPAASPEKAPGRT